MVYGYFYIKVYKTPDKKVTVPFIDNAIYVLNKLHNLDRIFYDYIQKPSNPSYKSFRDMLLKIMKADDTLVILSLFQLGKTIEDIYKALSIMRAKQVKLFVHNWEVDISNTMKKVMELSVDDLACYENEELYKAASLDYQVEKNTYRKIAGYHLNEKYIANKLYQTRYGCKHSTSSYDERSHWSKSRWALYHEQGY